MSAADAIKEALERKGIRQSDLVRAGVGTRSRVSEIVTGKRSPTKAHALKLAKALRLPLSKLIEV
jgi:antitoxin component HigA of HigAB toxin-antitoxin module